MSKQPSESQIKAWIREFYGLRDDIRLFDNPVGEAKMEWGGYVKFGLAPGSSDLVGWVTFKIGGFTIGVPLLFEVKKHDGRPTQDQLNFIAVARSMGCIAGVVRSVNDCEALIWQWAKDRDIEYVRAA